MSSYAASLPLTLDGQDGFVMIDDFAALIRQNLKMLIMTNPGERLMIPDFGVGIRKIIFEISKGNSIMLKNMRFYGDMIDAQDFLKGIIEEQLKKYLSLVKLEEFTIEEIADSSNSNIITFAYSVPSISVYDSIIFIESGGGITYYKNETAQQENIGRYQVTNNLNKVSLNDVSFNN